MELSRYIQALLAAPKFARQVTCHRVEEEREARFGVSRRPFARPVMEAAGLEALYSHQALATDLIRAGRDVVVTTPTASGKSMVYNLPVLEAYLRDPEIRALYMFPLKALAQDQHKNFAQLAARLHQAHPRLAPPRAALYDGDTSQHVRRKIRERPPTVLVTNPEMLHLGLLPYHHNWTTFLASLAFVVVDEAHSYRGVLGSHIANLLRRLDRLCLRYNSRPVRILCTATVGNALEMGSRLLGFDTPDQAPASMHDSPEPTAPDDPASLANLANLSTLAGQHPAPAGSRVGYRPPLAVVDESGAPRGRRHFVFADPEDSPSTLAIHLLQAALARELRTIVYCRSRRMTELISLWASDKAGPYRSRISSYRAGFLPEERRAIEARMAGGELLAVVSTSALELGIDIGSLDLCILVGYPGSVMSTLQRGGRVGRKGQESAVILIAGEDALDQFFIHNPDEFFSRPPEKAVLNPDNEVILARHLECAAAESALRQDEAWVRRSASQKALLSLERRGLLLRTAEGDAWLAARKRPQRDVELRGSGSSFQIEDPEGLVIGSVDAHQAFRETHPGAVYLHRGQSYTIRDLDLGAKRARAVPEQVKWHTRVRSRKDTDILEIHDQGEIHGLPVALGRLRVTEIITGYERRLNGSMTLMDVQPLDLPPQIFETEGLWFQIPDALRLAVEDELLHFMGSIHALEHVAIGLMPLLVMADRNDFGGISIPMHQQLGSAAVFVYDGMPGGAGLARSAYPLLGRLFQAIQAALRSCSCENGCPSCTHSPKCGSGNRPIDKQGALFLIDAVLDQRNREEPPSHPPSIPKPLSSNVFEMGVQADFPLDESSSLTEIVIQGRACRRNAVSLTASCPLMHHAPGGELEGRAAPQKSNTEPDGGPVMIFDVETRRSAAEVGGWHRADRMGVSVAVVWDGQTHRVFSQEELPAMFRLLRSAGLVVGFNSLRFDYKVLQPFAPYDLFTLPSLDLLDVIKKRLSYRVSLDNLGQATFDRPKSGDGLQALAWWKEGKLEAIADYCRDDVELTRQLYEFGKREGFLLFTNKAGQKVRIPVEW